MTLRLVGLARREWAGLDGEAASRGIDPLLLPPDRFLNMIYWWATHNGDPSEVEKFNRRLWRPPKGRRAAPGSPWSPEAETAAFGSLAAQVGAAQVRQGNPAP